MNPRELFRPPIHLMLLTESMEACFPNLLPILVKEREQIQADHNLSAIQRKCFCSFLDSTGEKYLKRMSWKFTELSNPVAFADALKTGISTQAWNRFKLVYLYEQALYQQLSGTKLSSLLSERVSEFWSIPDWPFFVATPKHPVYEGFICSCLLERDRTTGINNAFLSILAPHRDLQSYSNVGLVLDDPKATIGDALFENMAAYIVAQNRGTMNMSESKRLAEAALPFILDICSRKQIKGPIWAAVPVDTITVIYLEEKLE